jgi:uncharacterized protein (DUF2141 family)
MTAGKISRMIREFIFFFVGGVFLLGMFYACASIGSPQGGPVDEMPPRYVSSVPEPNALNWKKNKIEILFDELITVENPMEKVIITPPQQEFPVVKALGKKMLVEIKDSLRPNTTYTIDFTDAVADNNEKNVLDNFSFAFSTGEIVDSLMVSGTLLNAENLEPMPGILIGLHENTADSAFVTLPFFRTSKTNDKGQFSIRNVAPGSYKIYALNDLNRDYKFDQPGEEIAFCDSIIVPASIPAVRMDTLWRDSVTVDTVFQVNYTRFTPDDVVLFLFREKFERSYLRKSERPLAHKFALYFNSAQDTLPKLRFLNAGRTADDWGVVEFTEERKTLNYWIRDSLIYRMDTLQVEVSYFKSDTLNRPVMTSDTLVLFEKNPPRKEKKKDRKKDEKEEKIEFLGLTVNAPSSMEVFDSVKIVFSEPLTLFDSAYISLQKKIDTVNWTPQAFSVRQDMQSPMTYTLYHKWEYGREYKIGIDSAVFTGIYGKWNAPSEHTFKVKAEEEYGHLYVYADGAPGDGYGELLDGSDKVVRKAVLKDGGFLFMNLKPAKYYLRYVLDANGNGMWDTGDYQLHRHPEQVFYYPEFLDIRQNWRIEQHWDVPAIPATKQKPLEITKNKPKEKKKNASAQASQGQRNDNSMQNSRLIAPGM